MPTAATRLPRLAEAGFDNIFNPMIKVTDAIR
jgi:methylmalonyl-CoA mutase cobalamin-binding subunit